MTTKQPNAIPLEGEKSLPYPPQRNDEEDQSVEQVPLYRMKRVVVPVFILVVAAIATAWYWYVRTHDYVSTDDAYIDSDRVAISSKILGRIDRLTVDEGDTVTKGQILVELDDSDLQAQKSQALASMSNAQESVLLSKVILDRASDDYQRAEMQLKASIIPQEQYDHAKRALEAARAEYRIALSRVGTAKAQLEVVETQLKNTIIVSPMDGQVAKHWALQGDVVQAGQPILSVYDTKNVWVTANLEETNMQYVHLNNTVGISVDSYPDLSFEGKVFQVGTSTASQFSLIPPNNASGNFTKVTQRIPIKISIEGHPQAGQEARQLLPGMSVEVRIKFR
jgi:membrane fusion protein (multidrug efflux system)